MQNREPGPRSIWCWPASEAVRSRTPHLVQRLTTVQEKKRSGRFDAEESSTARRAAGVPSPTSRFSQAPDVLL